MKFEKIHLDDITRCYCASSITIGKEAYALFASENPESVCYSIPAKNFENREVVWNDRGGCMSIVPFQTREGEFLAVNEFLSESDPKPGKNCSWPKNRKWLGDKGCLLTALSASV